MNKQELKNKLNADGIVPSSYSLDGGLPHERLCLSKETNQWEVYYSERGSKKDLQVFANEEDACWYFYDELMNMPK